VAPAAAGAADVGVVGGVAAGGVAGALAAGVAAGGADGVAAGLDAAGAEGGEDFGAQAPTINPTASVANTNGLMFWTPSCEDDAASHCGPRFSSAASIFCMRSISVVWSAYMSDANL
jgi:hypothetical protein